MENNSFNVAVLGAGNIGSAVVARLMDLDKGIVRLNVKKILVRDTKKGRDISKDLLTDNFDEILNDDSIDLVIEVLGGIDPGKEYIDALLKKLESYSNKDLKKSFLFDFYENKKKNEIKIAFRFIFQSYERTLVDKEVDNYVSDIVKSISDIEGIEIPGMRET